MPPIATEEFFQTINESKVPISNGSTSVPNEKNKSENSNASAELNDDVLKSLGSVAGEELLAFFDYVRDAYEFETGSLNLPQLVVVGSTSCGKSSLLQAITKLPFPVENGICTLFPTETMIHRCDKSKQPQYSIHLERKGKGVSSLPSFPPRTYAGETWSDVAQHLRKDLKNVFAKLQEQLTMGQRDGNDQSHKLRDEVLKINVYKHDQAHFSVVDIPGLVSGGSGADQELSEKLARHYMSNPRAIVLAVMPAVDDIHNQVVLRLVREEKAMHRTIGVITKCDMLQDQDEIKTIELLKNRKPEHKLDLGWFAVRNRTTEEIRNGLSYQERDKREQQLFSTKSWSSLNGRYLGVVRLKDCLSKTLYRIVKKSFPEIQKDISKRIESSRVDLSALGPPRDAWRLQQVYLDDIQRKYQNLAVEWLSGVYPEGSSPYDSSKLRVHLTKLEEDFLREVEENGMEHKYLSVTEAEERIQGLDYPNIESSSDWEKKMLEKDDIFSWILQTWNENRADGLWYKPPVNFEERLWKLQIKSWSKFAEAYFFDASHLIDVFSDALLEKTCPDYKIRIKIRQGLEEQKSTALHDAERELMTILEELGRMKTTNRVIMKELEQSQSNLNQHFSYIGDNKLRQIILIYQNLNLFRLAAIWRFIDNVIIQVVERHLLGPSGLVYCFSVDWIRSLSEEQVDDLVGEDKEQRQKRTELETQIRELEDILTRSKSLQSMS